ncbi:MAG: thioredoxin family protein [Saprospiraceae bacterium]|nr:thioredoxin family protein [Saprospiraceae bacterium]MBK8483103.1 thioredoxin family protein [Saprospiraceae bacterium]MBK9220628.1 thioredoxin family protein [Saprospiraceae bacterium]MBK9722523.1 thioredoxin family protein [Saprospiraceae bacterium]MBK9729542.1 thioredoxin family protein [Saprospiraceae bacterium]
MQSTTYLKSSLFFLFSFLAFNMTSNAQASSSSYKAENAGWLVDLDEAYKLSKKTGKPILANFTGSDWCGWCKRLTASVFSKPEFKTWSSKNVILLELDFPKRKEIPANIRQQNASLQQNFQIRGYPTIIVFELDKDKKTNQYNFGILGQTGYKASVDEFTADVNQMIAKKRK